MAMILNIETSTDICSVGLAKNGVLVDMLIDNPILSGVGHGQHSRILAVLIKDLLEKNSLSANLLDSVAVSGGPGSYTGLRIGVSTAKGVCLGADLPLIAIDTLLIIAKMAHEKRMGKFDLIIPMIDAKRMEVYCSVFDQNLNQIEETQAKIIDENSFSNFPGKKILFCGNGAVKCQEVLKRDDFVFTDDVFPSAEYMSELAEISFNNNAFADLVYYEPFYLKSFVATTPKKIF
ncbi:MAG: tRNA (adenosine(37)-N6)-threonylcarbamoyltransferase complex dimerization subunit type 1 TsaB [Bacteroidales bacterium]|nr:tRNA (adenosine(37)-N6)-threonylcarbamoyltransferase complex dimerization subunit type 1 TsaB [Bacteroidales bacterium]